MRIQEAMVVLQGNASRTTVATSSQVVETILDTVDDENQASVMLTLSTESAETQQLHSQSKIQLPNDEVARFDSQYVAEQLTHVLTQREITVHRAQAEQDGANNVLVSIQRINRTQLQDELTVEAFGSVTTQSGESIQFLMDIRYQRDTTFESDQTFSGDRDLMDPLLINTHGGLVTLSNTFFEFDLDADGTLDTVSQTATGTGYLVFDKNANGVIDDGREMFGPTTGQGYNELRAYDDDGNGWIDEQDAIYERLGFLGFNASGATLTSLRSENVGAIYLGSAATQYDLNDDQGQFLARIKRTGMALSEQGQTLMVQEVDLKATEPANRLVMNGIPLAGQIRTDFAPVETPLSAFTGLNTALVNGRNAQTQVTLENVNEGLEVVESAPVRQWQRNPPIGTIQSFSSAEVHLFSSPKTSPMTVEQRQRHLQAWVTQAMNTLTPSAPHSSVNDQNESVYVPQMHEFRFLDNLPDRYQWQQARLDPKLQELRSMVEELKEIRRNQQEALKHLSLYSIIQAAG
ncbi:hypothetical protein [Reinekea sp. G2M2-21]|uniref:hypothetical protein n=1 Tax=Reinekea sp. G2M2-21 TaxID=2788942 RepID=UPI0018A8D230|nr:hypothetical protein [Reinekea sp. G2M2-21]